MRKQAGHVPVPVSSRVVLSLATDTKERMEQVNSMFGSAPAHPEGFVGLGEYQKGVEYLLNWYQECGYGELTIIDPHFRPTDLSVIKQLTDENNDLAIRILSHNGDFSADDYASEWRRVSAGVKTPIQIMLIKYVGKSWGRKKVPYFPSTMPLPYMPSIPILVMPAERSSGMTMGNSNMSHLH